MKGLIHLALFFRPDPEVALERLFWVRAPKIAKRTNRSAAAAELACEVHRCETRFSLEYIGFGETALAVDEQHFQDKGGSKALVFVNDCHLQAYLEAYGGSADEETVGARILRIGSLRDNNYRVEMPHWLERVALSPVI